MKLPTEQRPANGDDGRDWPRVRVLVPYILLVAVLCGAVMFAGDRFLFERDAPAGDLALDAAWRTLLFFVLVTGLCLGDRWWRRRRAAATTRESPTVGPE